MWELLGETRRPNLLKVSQRRHFAVDETHDESQRITVDLSRSVFKIVDQRLVPLGDIGPRVEVKLPAGQPEDSLPMARRLRGASYWMPFGTMANYFQFLLRGALPMETHMSLPEIESKFAITSGTPEEVFATSSASWSERRNWLHQPKGITADHWNYLRLWADCGHGVGTHGFCPSATGQSDGCHSDNC